MNTRHLRRAFVVFHLTLAFGLMFLSVRTVALALSHPHPDGSHAAILGGVETLGALLFLFPRTLLAGGLLLLATIGIAALAHAAQAQVRADLIIYAAGTVLVMAHGCAWSTPAVQPERDAVPRVAS